MKKYLIIVGVVIMVLSIFQGCKKDKTSSKSPGAGTYIDFLKNTQWVGTLDRSGYQYPPPCCLRINADTTIAVYAPFFFFVNNAWESEDSIKGKISTVDSLPDGRTKLKINFSRIGDVDIYITDRKQLLAVSPDGNKVPFEAFIFPEDVDINGTTWSGPSMGDGSFAYPDLSTISFSSTGIYTEYSKNGKIMVDNKIQPYRSSFHRKGAMVFMFGFNETNAKGPAYFGVLTPSGDQMMVYSNSPDARLPYYTQTHAWYGPIGVTPLITKR